MQNDQTTEVVAELQQKLSASGADVKTLTEVLSKSEVYMLSDLAHCTHEDTAFHYECPACETTQAVMKAIAAVRTRKEG